MRIDQLPDKHVAHVVEIDDSEFADDALRLREMGFDEGVEVEVLHRAAMGADPIAIRVGSNIVAMRRRYAAILKVRTVT